MHVKGFAVFLSPSFLVVIGPKASIEKITEGGRGDKIQTRTGSHLFTALVSNLGVEKVQVAKFQKSEGKNINQLDFSY